MKTLIKLLSSAVLLISTLSFAQTGGCIKDLPSTIDELLQPITPDQVPKQYINSLDQVRMRSYLITFNDALHQYQKEKVPQEFVELVNSTPEEHQTLTNTLMEKSSDFTSLNENILNRLGEAKTLEDTEALILMYYSNQLVEKFYNVETSSLPWSCIATTIGYGTTQVMSNPNTSVDDFGNSNGGIAGGGCTPILFPFPPKNCK